MRCKRTFSSSRLTPFNKFDKDAVLITPSPMIRNPMRAHTQIFATLFLLTSASLPAWSSPSKKPTPAQLKDFVKACTQAFSRSSNGDPSGIGQLICDCTAHESGHEKVTAAALEKETVAIRADSKHQIQDRKLLNAFQICSIDVFEKNADRRSAPQH